MRLFNYLCLAFICFFFVGQSCSNSEEEPVLLEAVFIGNQQVPITSQVIDQVPLDLTLEMIFSASLDISSTVPAIILEENGNPVSTQFQFTNGDRNVILTLQRSLNPNTDYTLILSDDIKSIKGARFAGQQLNLRTVNGTIEVANLIVDGQRGTPFSPLQEISLQPTIDLTFSSAIDTNSIRNNILLSGGMVGNAILSFSENNRQLTINYDTSLEDWTEYNLSLTDDIKGANGESFEPTSQIFFTKLDETPKFPILSDEELLTLIQRQTFKYFWDFGHPISGLARERNTSNDIVTFGGSGFGLMAMIVAVERGFITLSEAITRWKKIVQFLQTADRFHGAFPHWMNGATGKVQAFSARDNGGDLVETAFFVQGLLTVRQYLLREAPQETALMAQINTLWEEVEWDWYTKGETDGLIWHWSPDQEWAINLKVSGHNETQMVYILAAASPTHSISKEVYDKGYARSGNMLNGKSFYNITLPAGPDFGGPLFFSHYSYLGLDPRNLKDQYINYWTQNVHHTQINHAYCRDNPKNFIGYSELCWGLTASDNNGGYSAHSPNNDLGVITPTAAISSIVYTPEESLAAIKHFYYALGDRLWGEYGFYDAFNPTEGWVASSYLAIDQGPIICMIENYRTQLLWNLFMSVPEIQDGLDKLGFTY